MSKQTKSQGKNREKEDLKELTVAESGKLRMRIRRLWTLKFRTMGRGDII